MKNHTIIENKLCKKNGTTPKYESNKMNQQENHKTMWQHMDTAMKHEKAKKKRNASSRDKVKTKSQWEEKREAMIQSFDGDIHKDSNIMRYKRIFSMLVVVHENGTFFKSQEVKFQNLQKKLAVPNGIASSDKDASNEATRNYDIRRSVTPNYSWWWQEWIVVNKVWNKPCLDFSMIDIGNRNDIPNTRIYIDFHQEKGESVEQLLVKYEWRNVLQNWTLRTKGCDNQCRVFCKEHIIWIQWWSEMLEIWRIHEYIY